MTRRYDYSTFDRPVTVIPLGYVVPGADGYSVTVGDRIDDSKRSLSLTQEDYELLVSIDPTVQDRTFDHSEKSSLLWMANKELVALVGGLADLSIVPVPRRAMKLVNELRQGYTIRVGESAAFVLSELGGRFLPLIDGARTMKEIVATVKRETLANPNDREVIEKNEEMQGRSFDSILMEETLAFVKTIASSGAMTFEPTA